MRLLCVAMIAVTAGGDCVPVEQAAKHVGEKTCIHGKVMAVSATPAGTHLLRFCSEERECFSAVIFQRDLKDIGDVRELRGKQIEIEGKIRLYEGRPEIVVHDPSQLKGEAAKLPRIPKNYDVAEQGKFSPGQRPTHKHKNARWKYPRRGAESAPEE